MQTQNYYEVRLLLNTIFIQSRDGYIPRESLMLRKHTFDSFSGMKSAHCAKLICNYVERYYLHITHDSNKLVACFVARQ